MRLKNVFCLSALRKVRWRAYVSGSYSPRTTDLQKKDAVYTKENTNG